MKKGKYDGKEEEEEEDAGGGSENVKVDKKCPCMIAIENTAR